VYSNWNYQNLWGKICRIEKNPIILSPALFGCKSGKNYVETYIYWVLGEITVMPHKKFQDLNINKSYFCKSDTNRRNFNWRSRYKNLFNVLNNIIYTHIYALVVCLISKYYEMFALAPPFLSHKMSSQHSKLC
jgi:hypothetical protein